MVYMISWQNYNLNCILYINSDININTNLIHVILHRVLGAVRNIIPM